MERIGQNLSVVCQPLRVSAANEYRASLVFPYYYSNCQARYLPYTNDNIFGQLEKIT